MKTRTDGMKLNTLLLALAATSLVTLAAQARAEEQSASAQQPQNLIACKTFTGGGKEVTISTHGNVIQFESPLGFEHIAAGSFQEGYVLCNGATNRFDIASTESGFGGASCTTGANTATVTRETTDGLFRLRQDFTNVIAGGQKLLKIKMTVTNISGTAITGVVLRRHVDFDVDTAGTSGTGSFTNNHAATERDAVFAWNDAGDNLASEGHGMKLSHLTPNVAHTAKVISVGNTTCSPADVAEDNPVLGDNAETLEFNLGTINAGASKTMTVQYERF